MWFFGKKKIIKEETLFSLRLDGGDYIGINKTWYKDDPDPKFDIVRFKDVSEAPFIVILKEKKRISLEKQGAIDFLIKCEQVDLGIT